MRIPSPALISGGYGLALAALVASHRFTYAILELLMQPGYTLGTFERDWTAWHAVGCGFVGLINLLSVRDGDWPRSALRSLALSTALIYGIWAIQNFALMFAEPPRYRPLMWINVVLCLAMALLNVAYLLRPRAAEASR